MPDPVLGHEDPAHVGVVGEGDTEHVERLTLDVLAAGPQVEEARNGRLVGAHLGADTDPLCRTWLISDVTTSKRSGVSPPGSVRSPAKVR